MAKKKQQAETEPNPNAVPNKDVIQRIAYLHQASAYLSTVLPLHDGQPGPSDRHLADFARAPMRGKELEHLKKLKPKQKRRTDEQTQKEIGDVVSRRMVGTMREVAKRAVMRIDPSIKRTLCQVCGTHLLPGVNCEVRIKPSKPHGHRVRYTCQTCKSSRSIPTPPILPDGQPQDTKKLSKSAKRRLKAAKRQPEFHEREMHKVYAGQELVVKDVEEEALNEESMGVE